MATQYWICDFCGFQSESKSHCEKHEEICNQNPNNQGVEYLEEDDLEVGMTDQETGIL